MNHVIDTSGLPATPTPVSNIGLRDYFAGQALVALIQTAATPEPSADLAIENESIVGNARCAGWGASIGLKDDDHDREFSYAEYFADEAYSIADAMLWARDYQEVEASGKGVAK